MSHQVWSLVASNDDKKSDYDWTTDTSLMISFITLFIVISIIAVVVTSLCVYWLFSRKLEHDEKIEQQKKTEASKKTTSVKTVDETKPEPIRIDIIKRKSKKKKPKKRHSESEQSEASERKRAKPKKTKRKKPSTKMHIVETEPSRVEQHDSEATETRAKGGH